MQYPTRLPKSLLALLATALFAATIEGFGGASKKVLLQNVQTLTLRKDKLTSHRRVSAIPQLKCVGGNACRYYQVDVMRCENAGADYDDNNIQWTCKAEISDDFKLGSTDVRCEGYTGPKDPYVLKGSCGVEYRLVLTAKGEEKYRNSRTWSGLGSDGTTAFHRLLGSLFWLLFMGVVVWIAYSVYTNLRNNHGNGPRPPRVPRGGGGGGGGWWGGGDDNDAPPPYSPRPPRKQPFNNPARNAQGWQPGFWSGVMGGAAGGYFAGQRRNQNDRRHRDGFVGGPARGWGYQDDDGGQGSSSSYSSSTYTSTGFGSTNNR